METSDDGTPNSIQHIFSQSHQLEAEVRRALLEQLMAQSGEVVGAREILDLAEAYAWVTNPAQHHGGGG